MEIIKSTLPDQSRLKPAEQAYHYIDSFEGAFADRKIEVSSTDVGRAFFMSAPKWINSLFAWRNNIAKLFRLKTPGNSGDRQQQLDNFSCEPGERLGLFKVFYKTNNEVVLGEDDRHLDFRVSLYLDQPMDDKEQKKLTISTTVTFNHWFGRLYFLPVRPFHRLIVPTMLKGIIKHIETRGSV